MNSQRLPGRAYARQLDRLREDLDWWYASYRQAAAASSDMRRAAYYEERAAVLYDVIGHLVRATSDLYDLPRRRG